MVWIYRYMNRDGEQIDAGPYIDSQIAEQNRKQHACHLDLGFGSLVSPAPIEVPDNYKLYQGPSFPR